MLGLCCCMWGFSSCSEWGLLSNCCVWASHCGDFSCCEVWASAVAVHRLSFLMACEMFLIRDRTCILWIGRWILKHWTTREVLVRTFKIYSLSNFYVYHLSNTVKYSHYAIYSIPRVSLSLILDSLFITSWEYWFGLEIGGDGGSWMKLNVQISPQIWEPLSLHFLKWAFYPFFPLYLWGSSIAQIVFLVVSHRSCRLSFLLFFSLNWIISNDLSSINTS